MRFSWITIPQLVVHKILFTQIVEKKKNFFLCFIISCLIHVLHRKIITLQLFAFCTEEGMKLMNHIGLFIRTLYIKRWTYVEKERHVSMAVDCMHRIKFIRIPKLGGHEPNDYVTQFCKNIFQKCLAAIAPRTKQM